jgi:diguanylate cyclase (GGDEF)-like protein
VDVARLTRRLQRERAARLEAEAIAERVTRELYVKQQGLLLVAAVAKAANEAGGIEQAIGTSLEAIRAHLSVGCGHLWLVDDQDEMVSTDLWSSDAARDGALRQASQGLRFRAGHGLPGRVLAEGKALWMSDPDELATLRRIAAIRAAGLRSALCFPLFSGSEVVGALEFFSQRTLEPEEDLIALMTQIGTHLGRVVERQRAADTLLHQATHDALTQLPNRVLILDHLARSLARQRRSPDHHTAVLFVDLDGFKTINDTMGHASGDRVLRQVAERLGTAIRPQDTLGRLSGDEFVIVCEALSEEHDVVAIVERLAEAVRRPIDLDGEQFLVTASVGVALARGSEDPGALIEQADAAMYRSKARGRGLYEIFSDELRERIAARLDIERALRGAAERDELCLHFQPEIDLRTGAIVGAEALLRWRRGGALMLPGEFIGLAENTGLIVPIGMWVLREALCQLERWNADEAIPESPWISVNLSVRQLSDPHLMTSVAAALADYGANPSRLLLEVTESLVLDDVDAGLRVLTELRSLGAEIAIDDFGTGYASLSYLRRFPASVVKVDRSFIAEIDRDPRTRSIVEAVVAMARALDLKVVAEGIETAAQLAVVCELGFDIGQGFFIARPSEAADVTRLLADRRPFAALLAEHH